MPGARRRGRGEPGTQALDLAARRGTGARPDRAAQVHHRVRELAAPGRAPVRPAERARRRASRKPSAEAGPALGTATRTPAQVMAQAGRGRGRAAGSRPGAPRLGIAAGARRDRGGAQGRPTARRGGHVQPGARHRHGRGGPGRPGRGAAVGGQRPAAGRPRRAQRRRRLPRHHLPQVPGRPGPGGGGRRADEGGRDRGTEDPAQPAGRAGAADRRDDGGRRLAGGRARVDGAQSSAVRRPDQAHPRGGARHAGRALPERGLRRAAAPHRLGPGGGHHPGPAGRAAARRHQRRHHSRPGAVRRLPGLGHWCWQRGQTAAAGRGTRRGNGVRVAGRRRVRARRHLVADRGHHAGPGAGHARTRPAGQAAVLARRHSRPARRAWPGHRSGLPRAVGGHRGRGHREAACRPAWTSSRRGT